MRNVDKFEHFAIWLAITVVLRIFLNIYYSAIIALVLGFAKELYDHYRYNRFSWGDIGADIIGIVIGLILGGIK